MNTKLARIGSIQSLDERTERFKRKLDRASSEELTDMIGKIQSIADNISHTDHELAELDQNIRLRRMRYDQGPTLFTEEEYGRRSQEDALLGIYKMHTHIGESLFQAIESVTQISEYISSKTEDILANNAKQQELEQVVELLSKRRKTLLSQVDRIERERTNISQYKDLSERARQRIRDQYCRPYPGLAIDPTSKEGQELIDRLLQNKISSIGPYMRTCIQSEKDAQSLMTEVKGMNKKIEEDAEELHGYFKEILTYATKLSVYYLAISQSKSEQLFTDMTFQIIATAKNDLAHYHHAREKALSLINHRKTTRSRMGDLPDYEIIVLSKYVYGPDMTPEAEVMQKASNLSGYDDNIEDDIPTQPDLESIMQEIQDKEPATPFVYPESSENQMPERPKPKKDSIIGEGIHFTVFKEDESLDYTGRWDPKKLN